MEIEFYFIEDYIHIAIFNNLQMISIFSIIIIPFGINVYHMVHQITYSIGYLPFTRTNTTKRNNTIILVTFR